LGFFVFGFVNGRA